MRDLYIEYKYRSYSNYVGSFKGIFDFYSIWNLNNVITIKYSNGEIYSNVTLEDLNQWLKTRNYKAISSNKSVHPNQIQII